jgi:pilus assembly protein Flp/PilA
MFRRFLRNQSGATAIEYALIGGLIMVVIVGAVGTVGTNLVPIFQSVSAGFTN